MVSNITANPVDPLKRSSKQKAKQIIVRSWYFNQYTSMIQQHINADIIGFSDFPLNLSFCILLKNNEAVSSLCSFQFFTNPLPLFPNLLSTLLYNHMYVQLNKSYLNLVLHHLMIYHVHNL